MELRLEPSSSATPTIDQQLRQQPKNRNTELLPRSPDLAGALALTSGPLARPHAAALEHLATFNSALGNSHALTLVDQLRQQDAIVVTAGQQPALFGGPMLTLHKCAGAALFARALAAHCGRPVVPVFWVHDVDHDLGEANRCLVPAGGDFEKARLPLVHDGAPLANRRLDAECVQHIDGWLRRLGVEHLQGLRAGAGESLAHWSTRALLHALPRELPVLFASALELSLIARPFLEEAHAKRSRVDAAVLEGTRRVEATGLTPQVDARSGGQIWMLDAHGARRPVHESMRTLAGALSPGVLLRPVLQQWLLPVVAHVNGPAENAYFAQLPPLFEAFGLPVPALIPRPSITWVTPGMQRLMQAQGMTIAAAADAPDGWPRQPGDGAHVHELGTRLRPRGRPQERAHCWWAISTTPAQELERYDVLDLRPAVIAREAEPPSA